MKRFFQLLLSLIFLGYLMFAYFTFADKKIESPPKGLEIIVLDSLEKHFVEAEDIRLLLRNAKLWPTKQLLHQINTQRMESVILKNKQISLAKVYKTPSGLIRLEVKQRQPIMRIMTSQGSYYLDDKGETMPLSMRFAARVPIASGHIEKDFAQKELYRFALFLCDNEFWNKQIVQIYIHPNNDLELVPRIGDHRILLGKLNAFEEKLDKLKLFYEQVIPKMGWEKYSLINLKYKKQIVCTRKEK